MEWINESVGREFNWWLGQISEDPYEQMGGVGIRTVLRAHFLLIDYFYSLDRRTGGFGPRDLNLLHSALGRQTASFGGRDKWTDPFDRLATLFFGLIKNHAFHDANKRTALLAALYQLDRLGRIPGVAQKEFEDLTVAVADNRLSEDYRRFERFKEMDDPEVRFIADFLRSRTRKVDKRHYFITYKQLDTLLHKYDARLANPYNNAVDVLQMRDVKAGLLGIKRRREEVRVVRIGFPGWTTEVGRKAMEEVRRATGLTPENGFDSAVLFQGADPMQSLITEYRGPLRRLANK